MNKINMLLLQALCVALFYALTVSACAGASFNHPVTCRLTAEDNVCTIDKPIRPCNHTQLYLTQLTLEANLSPGNTWSLINTLSPSSGIGSPPTYYQIYSSNVSTASPIHFQALSRNDTAINLALYSSGQSNSTFTLSNISSKPIPPLSPVLSNPNLLTNGGFDSGALTPWQLLLQEASAGLSAPGLANTQFCFNATPGPSKLDGVQLALRQNVQTTPGRMYLLELQYLNHQPGGHGTNTMDIVFGSDVSRWGAAFGDSTSDYVSVELFLKGGVVRELVIPFLATEGVTPITLQIGTRGGRRNWVAVDGVSFRLAS